MLRGIGALHYHYPLKQGTFRDLQDNDGLFEFPEK
jgi:hypothetical protein